MAKRLPQTTESTKTSRTRTRLGLALGIGVPLGMLAAADPASALDEQSTTEFDLGSDSSTGEGWGDLEHGDDADVELADLSDFKDAFDQPIANHFWTAEHTVEIIPQVTPEVTVQVVSESTLEITSEASVATGGAVYTETIVDGTAVPSIQDESQYRALRLIADQPSSFSFSIEPESLEPLTGGLAREEADTNDAFAGDWLRSLDDLEVSYRTEEPRTFLGAESILGVNFGVTEPELNLKQDGKSSSAPLRTFPHDEDSSVGWELPDGGRVSIAQEKNELGQYTGNTVRWLAIEPPDQNITDDAVVVSVDNITYAEKNTVVDRGANIYPVAVETHNGPINAILAGEALPEGYATNASECDYDCTLFIGKEDADMYTGYQPAVEVNASREHIDFARKAMTAFSIPADELVVDAEVKRSGYGRSRLPSRATSFQMSLSDFERL